MIIIIRDAETATAVNELLGSGYVLDPALKYNPVVVDGLGAIYHLTPKESVTLPMGEFDQVAETAEREHGVVPVGEGWLIHMIYQKNVIWKRVKPQVTQLSETTLEYRDVLTCSLEEAKRNLVDTINMPDDGEIKKGHVVSQWEKIVAEKEALLSRERSDPQGFKDDAEVWKSRGSFGLH